MLRRIIGDGDCGGLDRLLVKTWVAVGGISEVAEGHRVTEQDIVEQLSARSSALAALESCEKRHSPTNPSREEVTEPPRYKIFRKIKDTIDAAFDDISACDCMFLDVLFDQTPVSLEREKRKYDEKPSMMEAIFMRTGKNLTNLNLYTDTGVYIMEKALRKIASANSVDGKVTESGIQRILRLTAQYELPYLAYEDSDGTHHLADTVKELVGEKRYDAFVQQAE